MLKTRPVTLNWQRGASRLAGGAPERFEFDPANTWRRRRREEMRVLSAMERRYFMDLLAQIEASGGRLSDELFVSARRVMATGLRRSARPLGLLVERGLLVVSNEDDKLRCFITREGCELIRRWLGAKPPDFLKRFPRLYRELGLCEAKPEGGEEARGVHVGLPRSKGS